jgi:CubicO group peptidase (beta-lactamase class C family)
LIKSSDFCLSGSKNKSINGFVKPGFEPVRLAFVENFERRKELGAACCIYHRGEKVVDLWGGIRNKATGEPWEENTMVMVFSTTKGLSGLAIALAQSRGLIDYDQPVAKYWPEFAQNGKEKITVRQLLAHQAGLFALDAHLNKELLSNSDQLAGLLSRQSPEWEPGSRQAYHAITLGLYEGELIRRVDPRHRSLGQFFQDEIANPLGLDFYIRLPENIPNSRLAVLKEPNPLSTIFSVPFALTLAVLNSHSVFRRALMVEDVRPLLQDTEHVYHRNLEIPSGTGVGTARSIAYAYSVFADGGHELGLREETLRQLMAPPVPPAHGFYDECLKIDYGAFSLGFLRPTKKNPFGSPGSFGAPGSGGSFAFADPEAKIGYAYVLNGMGSHLIDPRDVTLRNAMHVSIEKLKEK